MLLAIDVGNTNITVGIFQRERLISCGRMSTLGPRTVDEVTITLQGLLHNLCLGTGYRFENIDGLILSSVVPQATSALKQALKSLVKPRPLIVGETIRAPIKNRYRVPSQVGQDRLVNAVAAYYLYGGPAIVVDFGTAVTVDLVSKRCEYLGGLIVPGIAISLEALVSRAALLPKIELAPPKELLGRDTQESMRSGIFFGYGALCDGVVSKLKTRHAPKAKVIATGGHAPLIVPYCRSVKILNTELTLQGLRLTYERAQKNY